MQGDELDFLGDGLTYGLSRAVIGMGLKIRSSAALAKGASLLVMGLWVFFSTIYQVLVPGMPKVEVMGAVGAISANWEVVLGTAFYGLLFGLVMALFLMFKHGIVKRTFSRLLGAALTAAAKVKTEMPDDSPKIPLGLTFKLGVILAGLEHMLFIPMPWSKWL